MPITDFPDTPALTVCAKGHEREVGRPCRECRAISNAAYAVRKKAGFVVRLCGCGTRIHDARRVLCKECQELAGSCGKGHPRVEGQTRCRECHRANSRERRRAEGRPPRVVPESPPRPKAVRSIFPATWDQPDPERVARDHAVKEAQRNLRSRRGSTSAEQITLDPPERMAPRIEAAARALAQLAAAGIDTTDVAMILRLEGAA